MIYSNIEFIKCNQTEEDFLRLRKIHRLCMEQNIVNTMGIWDDDFQKTRLFKHYTNFSHSLLFIKLNNEIIGTVNIHDKEFKDNNSVDQHQFIEQLYIIPKYQGKGIGSWILNTVADQTRETRLSVLRKDSLAKNFYIKNGFVIYNEDEWQNYFLKNKIKTHTLKIK